MYGSCTMIGLCTQLWAVLKVDCWLRFSLELGLLPVFFMVALWNRADHYIFILSFVLCIFLSFFSSPNLSRRRVDVCHTCTHGVALGNLRRRSETCCTRLTANTWRKKVAKNRHLGTIAQICRAISLQLRHVSTIGKTIRNNRPISSTCSHNVANFGLLVAEIDPVVWGTPSNFNGFRVLAALLHGI